VAATPPPVKIVVVVLSSSAVVSVDWPRVMAASWGPLAVDDAVVPLVVFWRW
jgi:hypothetical protein